MKPVTINTLKDIKSRKEKFAVVSAYDASFASAINAAGIEVILVGDSLGMVLQGKSSTLPVTIDEMAYHTAAVCRGNDHALIIADMPYMSYQSQEASLENAAKLMREGAHMVKLEGGSWLAPTIEQLVRCATPVCAHLGLTPQSVNVLGGYKVQGRDANQAKQILNDAKTLQDSGADLLVLECVPSELATEITQALSIPVIGIGAGNGTDAQVLVAHDMLGLNPKPAKFVKNFLAGSNSIQQAFENYAEEVRAGSFPSEEHSFH